MPSLLLKGWKMWRHRYCGRSVHERLGAHKKSMLSRDTLCSALVQRPGCPCGRKRASLHVWLPFGARLAKERKTSILIGRPHREVKVSPRNSEISIAALRAQPYHHRQSITYLAGGHPQVAAEPVHQRGVACLHAVAEQPGELQHHLHQLFFVQVEVFHLRGKTDESKIRANAYVLEQSWPSLQIEVAGKCGQ